MVDGELINFGMEPVTPSIIMVAGVGGAGSNAVNHMFELGIAQVSFMICNTDEQALRRSPVPLKIKLGATLTEGLGAGNVPERGRLAAMESLEEITANFKREGTRMVFITAGMGGGTGTGAAPVVAKAARDMGLLTVGIVTLPFRAEGRLRTANAMQGLEELRKYVDALLLINNENIQELYGKLPIMEAFGKADDILATAAKGIAEVITREEDINVDFADVNTIMRNSGIALMGSARTSGEGRARRAAEMALASPLLNHNNIVGAQNILINISYGSEPVTMEEMKIDIMEYIQDHAGNEADIIWGAGSNPALGEEIEVTVVATGFHIDESAIWNVPTPEKPAPRAVPVDDPEVQSSCPPETAPAAAERPPRWQPPVEPRHPFEKARQQAAPATPGAPAGQIPPAAPGMTENPFVPRNPQQVNKVLEVKSDDTYGNLKDVLERPAFIRRKSKFVVNENAAASAKGSSKAVLKEEQAPEQKPSSGGSLFD